MMAAIKADNLSFEADKDFVLYRDSDGVLQTGGYRLKTKTPIVSVSKEEDGLEENNFVIPAALFHLSRSFAPTASVSKPYSVMEDDLHDRLLQMAQTKKGRPLRKWSRKQSARRPLSSRKTRRSAT